MKNTEKQAKDIYNCVCGGRSERTENKDGYPAEKCKECGKTWWHTTCWRSSRHIIDERVAKKCEECSWWICPICGACDPGGCKRCDKK